MQKILLSPLAERDLVGIWRYSLAQWGEAQADRYLDELEEGFSALLEIQSCAPPVNTSGRDTGFSSSGVTPSLIKSLPPFTSFAS
jgi:plasmid stabilization system protein ParE